VKEIAQSRAQLTTGLLHCALRILTAGGTAVMAMVLVAVLGAGRRRAILLRLALFLRQRPGNRVLD
jgi:hypothetical protein